MPLSPSRTRGGLAFLVLAAATLAAVVIITGRRGRPADERYRGHSVSVTVPSGALTVSVPSFLSEAYGGTRVLGGDRMVGVMAGDAEDGTVLAIALAPEESEPFAGGDFPAWFAEAYLECLAAADSAAGRTWWALERNEDIASTPFAVRYAVARNTIPMISRVCVAGTNGVSPLSLRIFALMSERNFQRFEADIKAAFASLVVDEDRARHRFNMADAR